jgi:hypothetical protein
MRFWNLSEFSEIEDKVVLDFADSGRQPFRAPRQKRLTQIRVGVCTAAIFAGLSFVQVAANSNEVRIPATEMAVAQSIPEERPPFDSVFANRFNEVWTEPLEEQLLEGIVREAPAGSDELANQDIDSIYSNQQEELSGNVNRLSRDLVGKIYKTKKSA